MQNKIGNLEDFIKDGNKVTFIGESFPVNSEIRWSGAGNYIEIGEHVKFNKVRITFIGNNGKLIIGKKAFLRGFLVIGGDCMIDIGEDVFINRVSDIRALESCNVSIGRGCLFSDISIYTSDMHSVVNLSDDTRINNAQSIKIEENVWLAELVRVSKGSLIGAGSIIGCLLYTSPSPRDLSTSRMPSSA